MYPDLITPKAHPDLLQKPDYDPYGLIPAELPPHPRLFTTPARLARAKARLEAGSAIDRECLGNLLKNCQLDESLPPEPAALAATDQDELVGRFANAALRNALAYPLTGKAVHRERALALLRLIARANPQIKWSGYEGQRMESLASSYDLLAADGLSPADDNLFREMLWSFPPALDPMGHRHCNNHNAFNIMARLAVGVALGHRQPMHDALYGCQRDGKWRYGLIHLLRHDFLSDGMQWEGSMSYHMLVMTAVCEAATILENIGVDIWKRGFPSLVQDDCCDEHRNWGPKGDRHLQAGFDAFLYQAFPNGDYSNLHDQILGNMRGAGAWWPLFCKAYEIYGEARYAWAARMLESANPPPAGSVLPIWFRTGQGDIEFLRLECRERPAGHFSFAEDATLSLTGRHVRGCSLFPAHGSAMLRAAPEQAKSAAAYFYFGPHCAGHRSPAALHLEVHAGGQRITHAPHLYKRGYDGPEHLTWTRSTIAHNTVAVDQMSMHPYDFETQSIWEYDRWRDTITDSVLEFFQPEAVFKAVRASNDNVYAGVKLDRTLVLTETLLIDVFRAASDRPRQYDWAVHCHGQFARPADAESVQLGQRRGYGHFSNAWRHPARSGWAALPFSVGGQAVELQVLVPAGADAALVLAQDPPPDDLTPIGDLSRPQPRTAILARTRAAAALFVSVWSFAGPVEAQLAAAEAGGDVILTTRQRGQAQRWTLPLRGTVQLAGA